MLGLRGGQWWHRTRDRQDSCSALELLHGASLFHDDIVDEAAERHCLPALHVRIGIGPALILGNYLILRAFTVLQESHHVYGPERTIEASHALNYYYAQLCWLGELHELMPIGENNPEDEYLTIVQGKTASQFAAVMLPAIVGGRTSGEIEALRTYGLNVGIAFQIQNDVLDIVGDTGVLAKPVRTGLVKERLLLPLIYLEHYGSPTALEQYRRIPQTSSPSTTPTPQHFSTPLPPTLQQVHPPHFAQPNPPVLRAPYSAPYSNQQINPQHFGGMGGRSGGGRHVGGGHRGR